MTDTSRIRRVKLVLKDQIDEEEEETGSEEPPEDEDFPHSAFINMEAFEYVRTLGLPWSWLGAYLDSCFLSWLEAGKGVVPPIGTLLPVHDAPVPKFDFRTYPGKETVLEALQRLKTFRRRLLTALPPRGRVPDKSRVSLERNAHWLFRSLIQKESFRAIARSDLEDPERHTEVSRAVGRARSLLDLIP